MIDGFTSETVRSVCKAVKKDVTSAGDMGGGLSGKRECKGVTDGELRARVNVCFSDENPRDVDEERLACWKEGEGARGGLLALGGLPFRRGDEGGALAGLALACFFLLLNGRRNDQSDSNCTDSISEEADEWSSKAASRS